MEKTRKHQKGFTLIEILIVIGIIAILATVVLVALNPARQFAQARNSQRISNINTILNAIGQRIADNKGLFPVATGCPALTASATYTIGVGASAAVESPASANIDMSCLVPTYIASQFPVDPSGGIWNGAGDYNTKYNVMVDGVGRYTLCAPKSIEPAIPVTVAICVVR